MRIDDKKILSFYQPWPIFGIVLAAFKKIPEQERVASRFMY